MWLYFLFLSSALSILAAPQNPTVNPFPSSSTTQTGKPHTRATPAKGTVVQHGWCGVHLHQIFGDPYSGDPGDPNSGWFSVQIYDSTQQLIGSLYNGTFDYNAGTDQSNWAEENTDVPSLLPYVLIVSHEGKGKIYRNGDGLRVRFRYGGDEWWSDGGRCRIGNVDTVEKMKWLVLRMKVAWTRDMDCGFAC
jgi:hypothetical protein